MSGTECTTLPDVRYRMCKGYLCKISFNKLNRIHTVSYKPTSNHLQTIYAIEHKFYLGVL
jgi:hypothetical protein